MPAVQSLSPAIQQAAADPTNAASMLMAAAAAFAGNSMAPQDSKNVASAVNSFVAEPAGRAGRARARTGRGAGRRGSPARGRGPGPCGRAGTRSCTGGRTGPRSRARTRAGSRASACTRTGTRARTAKPHRHPHRQLPGGTGDPAPEAAPAPAAAPAFGPDSPPTQDFMYPSISNGCLEDGGNVLATAISVAGPAKIPTPGPGPGQTAYVFTAVGTPGPAAEQKLPLNVTWVNLTTGKSGSATLKPRSGHQSRGPDHADGDRRHRLRQHHVDDLRSGHHHREAVPVHADHRLDGGAVTDRVRSVGHEQNRVPVVTRGRDDSGEVSLRLLDQVVLVLAGDGLAARAS